MAIDDLYERDFYAWTQAQAEALRKRGSGANALDYDNLAEEVGDMGKAERDAVESLVAQVLVHLIKLEFSANEDPKAHWRAEIVAFRKAWKRKLSPSIRAFLVADLEELHRDAFELARAQFAAEEPSVALDETRRWMLAEVLGE
jgi:hypothetical protein